MKKFFAPLLKLKFTTRILVALILLLGLGIVFKGGTRARATARPITTFKQDVGTSTQVIVVRAGQFLTSDATLEALEFDGKTWRSAVGPVSAKIGRNGFSTDHQEGDGTTPQGVFTMTEAFGSQSQPSGSKLHYVKTNANSWWVSDPDSDFYNTPVAGPPAGRWRESFGERLQDSQYSTAYRYAVAVNYNRSPKPVPYAGSAIFLHVGSKPTSGCVAIAEADLLSIMRWLDPAKSPKIVMGTDPWLVNPEPAPPVSGTEAVGLRVLPPTRILDTRTGNGGQPIRRVSPKSSTTLQVAGRGGVPTNATVVALNLTIDQPSQATYLTVSPGGAGPILNASNLNAHAGDARASLVLARLGTDGAVRIYNDAGEAHLIADVVGYGSPSVNGGFQGRAPSRALDTRLGIGMADQKSRAPIAPDTYLDLPLGDVPVNATAVVMNVTSTSATRSTFLTAYASGTDRPNASTLNARAKQDTANLAIVPIGAGNMVRFYNSEGDTHLIADVFGYILSDRGDRYVPATEPTRVIDTRSGVGSRGQIAPGQPIALKIPSLPSNATSIAFTLTGVNASTATDIRVYPSDDPGKSASNLNVAKLEPSANLVVIPLGKADQVDQIVNSDGATDVLVDVNGWFVAG